MRDFDLAYAAGVIDSDGTIGVFHKKNGGDCYEPRVGIRQVESQAIDLLYELFGGCRRDAYPHGGENCRPQFEWRATARVGCVALVEMLPYLRIKKAQAENAIEVGRLNAERKFRPVLVVDESEGWVTTAEASLVLNKPYQSLRSAVSSGQLPSVGFRATRKVPLATTRLWVLRQPGGPSRSVERTEELKRRCELSKELNRVGLR